MTDIALHQISALGAPAVFDVALDGYDLATDKGLRTAVMLLLFIDARADASEVGPSEDRRGWYANPTLGSKLWLLTRAKESLETLARAKRYAEEGLARLIAIGAARQITVETEWIGGGRLGLRIVITMSNGRIWDEVFEFSLR